MDAETQIMDSGENERTSVNGSKNETLPIYKCDFVNDEKDDYMEVWVVWMEGIVQVWSQPHFFIVNFKTRGEIPSTHFPLPDQAAGKIVFEIIHGLFR